MASLQGSLLAHQPPEHVSTVEGIPAEGLHDSVHHAHHAINPEVGHSMQLLQQLQYAHSQHHPVPVSLQEMEHHSSEDLHHQPHTHHPTISTEHQDGQCHDQHHPAQHVHDDADLQTTGIPVPSGTSYSHQMMDHHQQLAHYHQQLAQFHPQAYQQQLAQYHQDVSGMYVVQGVPHQDLQGVYQDANGDGHEIKHAESNSIEEEAAAAHHLTALRNTVRVDGHSSLEEHAHAMGHHGMGQMQMDGSQNLHGSGLPAYPHLDPEIIAAASAGGRSIPTKRKAWRASHEGESLIQDPIEIGSRARRRQTRRPDRLCHHEGCFVTPTYNYPNEKKRIFCVTHKLEGMINVVAKRCSHPDCHVNPRFNYEGSTRGLYCSEHKLEGMINVIDRRCQEPECVKFPSHNYPGSHKKLYCATHKKDGMVDMSHGGHN